MTVRRVSVSTGAGSQFRLKWYEGTSGAELARQVRRVAHVRHSSLWSDLPPWLLRCVVRPCHGMQVQELAGLSANEAFQLVDSDTKQMVLDSMATNTVPPLIASAGLWEGAELEMRRRPRHKNARNEVVCVDGDTDEEGGVAGAGQGGRGEMTATQEPPQASECPGTEPAPKSAATKTVRTKKTRAFMNKKGFIGESTRPL
jgi:hypothetical protein